MGVDTENNSRISLMRRIGWRRVGTWLLGLIVLSAIVIGPWGLLCYIAGLLNSSLLSLLSIPAGFFAWVVLFAMACGHCLRDLWARRKRAASYWLCIALGIPLAFGLHLMGPTRAPIDYFARGFVTYLEIRTDIDAVQTWVESLDPCDCRSDAYSGDRGRRLSTEEQPQVLTCQNGEVQLELDPHGRPRVRLRWDQSRAGMWGLVIGHREMETPPSDPNTYGEWRAELRPGVYFWHIEG